MNSSHVQALTVSQANQYIKNLIDGDVLLNHVCVLGELFNYKIYPSGHHYFTIKDAESSLKCVMFRNAAARLRFRPSDGIKVYIVGRISVYPKDGTYQLYCDSVIEAGSGNLMAQFEAVKRKLEAKGYFDSSCKKPIPSYPNRVGIITSPAGAAVHDMIRIIRKRFPLAEIIFIPVHVQGEEAVKDIVTALDTANRMNVADVLIVGRGGGSMEDLWCFNSEMIADAIHMSSIPVISAVGHEPDVTISDFVADVRAATPTHGAEMAVPDIDVIIDHISKLRNEMMHRMDAATKIAKLRLEKLMLSPYLRNPDQIITDRYQYLDSLTQRLLRSVEKDFEVKERKLQVLSARLDSISPLKVLSRGYSVVSNHENQIVHDVKSFTIGETIQLRFSDGIVGAVVSDISEVPL